MLTLACARAVVGITLHASDLRESRQYRASSSGNRNAVPLSELHAPVSGVCKAAGGGALHGYSFIRDDRCALPWHHEQLLAVW